MDDSLLDLKNRYEQFLAELTEEQREDALAYFDLVTEHFSTSEWNLASMMFGGQADRARSVLKTFVGDVRGGGDVDRSLIVYVAECLASYLDDVPHREAFNFGNRPRGRPRSDDVPLHFVLVRVCREHGDTLEDAVAKVAQQVHKSQSTVKQNYLKFRKLVGQDNQK